MLDAWIPVFRAGKWSKLRRLVPNGEVTQDHLREMEANGNRIIKSKSYVPSIGPDHKREGDAYGWVTEFKAVGDLLYMLPEWNELGKAAIKDKRRRFLSAEIRKDFNLTGAEDGETVPGLTPIGAALLGRDIPEVKGLTDLSTQLSFDEFRVMRDKVEINSQNDIIYFSEIKEVEDMENEELTRKLDEEKKLREKAEADLVAEKAKSAKIERDAAFAEKRAAVASKVKALQDGKKLGAEAAAKATELLLALHVADSDIAEMSEGGTKTALEVSFGEFLDALPAVDAARRVDMSTGKEGEGDGTGDLTAADLSEGYLDPEKAKKVDAQIEVIFAERRKTDAKVTKSQIIDEIKKKKKAS